jgi:hypothetical protein
LNQGRLIHSTSKIMPTIFIYIRLILTEPGILVAKVFPESNFPLDVLAAIVPYNSQTLYERHLTL